MHSDAVWHTIQFGSSLSLAKLTNILYGKFIAMLKSEIQQNLSKSSPLMFVLILLLLELRISQTSTGFSTYKLRLNLTSLFSRQAQIDNKTSQCHIVDEGSKAQNIK
jgi:hypothetical protein